MGQRKERLKIRRLMRGDGPGEEIMLSSKMITKRVKSAEHLCFWESGLFKSDEETLFLNWRKRGLFCAVTIYGKS